jgi:RNA polymerase sigma-70 factor, ECF subfamily
LPEPIDPTADPTVGVERDETLELAVRALLEKLSPTERAVFVLRDAFDYPYRQIGDVLGLSEANARQLCVRARARLGSDRRRLVSGTEHRRLLAAITAASQTGELEQLEQLLAGEAAPLPIAA